eukprot:SAG31_NODE_8606_length_1421_cov_1.102118_1_plen_110_part_10
MLPVVYANAESWSSKSGAKLTRRSALILVAICVVAYGSLSLGRCWHVDALVLAGLGSGSQFNGDAKYWLEHNVISLPHTYGSFEHVNQLEHQLAEARKQIERQVCEHIQH